MSEPTPDNSASPEAGTGGSSKQLTQGEVVFVTLLTLLLVAAIALAAYFVWQRKHRADGQKNFNDSGQGTDIDTEAGALDTVNEEENNNTDDDPLSNSLHGPGTRRGSIGSNESEVNTKRTTVRRASTCSSAGSGGGGGASRRLSTGSVCSNVSSNYKLAAIDHMKQQIPQTGR